MAADETAARLSLAFPRLDETEIATLRKLGTLRRLQDGETLVEAGDPAADFFVVLSGAIEIVDPTGDQPRQVAMHGPGQFTGSVNLLKQWRTVSAAVARGDTEVLHVPIADLRRVIVDQPALGEIILKAFIARWDLILDSSLQHPRLIGSERSRPAFEMRDFLTRNQVPFTWLSVEAEPQVAELLQRFGLAEADMPAVVCGHGPLLRRPSILQLAEAIGLKRPLAGRAFDLVVVGAGPAGLAAAVYGSSEGLSTLVLDSFGPGGQAGASMKIENYLGFPTGITGGELMSRALLQAQKFGAEFSTPSPVAGLDLTGPRAVVRLDDGEGVEARCVLIATGADYHKLDVPGYERFEGLGIYYAATPMELASSRGDEAVVVGGGNSAGQAAVFLAQHLKRVWVILRGGDLHKSMSSYLVERLQAAENVEVLTHTQIKEMRGDGLLEAVMIENTQTGERRTLDAHAIFSFIGAVPRTGWLPAEIETDAKGFICTGRAVLDSARWPLDREPFPLETSYPGVFAAGDVRLGSVKRCAAGVGEGSMAVAFVHQYLSSVVE
jgi:thioredoxin reductase (NADPH)